jgi:chloride channel 3/4/5
MPKSVSSYRSAAAESDDRAYDPDDEDLEDSSLITPTSPTSARLLRTSQISQAERRGNRLRQRHNIPDEGTSLLGERMGTQRSYASMPGSGQGTPRQYMARQNSFKIPRQHSRRGSFSMRLVNALGADRVNTLGMNDKSSDTVDSC